MNQVNFIRAAACIFLLCGISMTAKAAKSADGIWSDLPEASINRSSAQRQIVPSSYRTVTLDRQLLNGLLSYAPAEASMRAASSPTVLSLPMPDGSFARFGVVDSPIMEPGLAAQFPEIRTWAGQGLDDPTATLRFDVTPTGFHAQVLSASGSYYIDPYQPGDVSNYIAYAKADMTRTQPMICGVDGHSIDSDKSVTHAMSKISSGGTLRTYRLAVAATGEYTAFHGGTVALGQAAIVTTINRVNGIYEREVAVRMVLVANNSLLVYTNAGSDPYTNDDGFAMLGENQTRVDSVIGSNNYDFGHVVSTGGGGVAGLGVICAAGSKARGVTGSFAPVGDPFDVDYVAHEMGHQFGGNHTFNSNIGSCQDNRNAGTAYETGSGITIQAYAGICATSAMNNDNVQNNSVDYFHRASLNEILAHINGSGGTCAGTTSTGNTPPSVSTAASFNVPVSTPFELTASGSDVNGDTLTYLWENYDLGPINAPGVLADDGGPLFRNYSPTTSPSRTFPALASILSNTTTTWEKLPTVTRSRNFRVTARDNRVGGGGTNEANTTLNFTSTAGPFLVTAPNTAVSWVDANNQTISWNVANTNAAPVSAANVRIRLSTDGGNSWPIELAASVPNNGSAVVFVPASVPATTQARIRVEGVGNVFFDVSNVNFTITDNPTPGTDPALSITGTQIITGNNLLEPNECNQLTITLGNSGLSAATGVTATLSTSDPNVTVTQATASFANIAASGSQTSTTPFQISSSNALVCLSNVAFTLNVSYSGGGSPFVGNFNLPVGQMAPAGGYSFVSSSGASIPAGGTLIAGSQADDGLVTINTPFAFSIYGTQIAAGSAIRASTNGALQMVASGGSAEWQNEALPSAGDGSALGSFPASLPVLMPYWDDVDTAAAAVTNGGIFQQVLGIAPNRTWVIEWRGEQQGNPATTVSLNFAIEFNEASSTFSYIYANPAANNGATATVGVQAATTGTSFTQYSLNSASLSAGQRLTASLPAGLCTAGSGGCVATPPGVTVTQSGGSTDVTEGVGNDTYTLVLNAQPSASVTVTVSPDAQVSASPTLLTFTTLNWAVPQTVTVTAVNDAVAEGAHSGSISHTANGGGYTGVSIAAVTANITDNDTATLTIAPVSQNEGNSGNSNMVFTLQLSGQVAGGFSVDYQTSDGNANAGIDYTATSGTLNFDSSLNPMQSVTVPILGDTTPEGNETFTLSLTTASGLVQINPASVNGTILNDDAGADTIFGNGFEGP